MQIELSKVIASPQAIRTTWSEEKMEELAQSIEQHGLLQAIKVRPVGDEYEIVYGHRRAEASRRAGLAYIEAVVDWLNDSNALIQGLIENVQREDISNADEGNTYIRLRDECRLKLREIAQLVGKSENWVGRCALLAGDESMAKLSTSTVFGAADAAVAIRGAVGRDFEARKTFAAKVVDEGLTVKQTRDVAAALKRTQSPKARERILSEPIVPEAPVLSEAIKMLVDADEDEERTWWAYQAGEGAKNLLRKIKVTRESFKRGWLVVERGAVGPEHMPYLEKRLRKLGEYIIELADDLDERRKFAIGG